MTNKDFLPKDKFFDVCKNGTTTDVKNAISAGANVNTVWAYKNYSKKNFTPLMVAVCDNPNFDVVSELIAQGAKIDMQDANKRTALMWAVLRCIENPDSEVSFEAVRVLIANGADVNLQDNDDKTVLMLALEGAQNLDVIFRCFGDKNSSNWLNFNFGLRDKDGMTAHDFVEKGVSEERFANDWDNLSAINSLTSTNVVDDDE